MRRFTGRPGDEFLLEVKKQDFSSPGLRRSPEKTPLWKTPADIDQLFLATARDGTNLWGFDWRKPALTYFDQRWEEPFVMKLSFMPKALTNESPFGDQYVLTSTRDGLVVFRKYAEGFWIIPQRDLDAALVPLVRSRGPERERRPFSPAHSTSNNFAWADEVSSDAAQIVRKYQMSKTGSLNMSELVTAIRKESVLAPYRPLIKGFQFTLLLIDPYDTNGNQRIDGPELDAMIEAGKPKVTREEFMQRWDANKNDELEAEEMRAAVAEKTARGRMFSANWPRQSSRSSDQNVRGSDSNTRGRPLCNFTPSRFAARGSAPPANSSVA